MLNEDAFIDANIFIDIARKRKGWSSSAAALAEIKKRKGFVSALTVAILYYVKLRGVSPQNARQETRELIHGLRVAPVTQEIICAAFDRTNLEDFEDAIQFYSARAVAKTIVTRNKRHYVAVQDELEIITPEEFLNKYSQPLRDTEAGDEVV